MSNLFIDWLYYKKKKIKNMCTFFLLILDYFVPWDFCTNVFPHIVLGLPSEVSDYSWKKM